MSTHPNYEVCKNFQRNSLYPYPADHPYGSLHGTEDHFQLVTQWRDDIARFTYELTDEIGFRPSRHALIWPHDPSKPVGPGNVIWFHRPREGVRSARDTHLQRREASQAFDEAMRAWDPRQQTDGSFIPGEIADKLTHADGCESPWLPPIECPCTDAIRERHAEF